MTTEQLKTLKDNLWAAAIRMRSDSDLKLSEFATPVLGIIFLRFADNKYALAEEAIQAELEAQQGQRRQREVHEIAIEKCGFYLPAHARYDYLLNLPESEDGAKAIQAAMEAIESYREELRDTLPKDEYDRLVSRGDQQMSKNALIKSLLRTFADIPREAAGDIFGNIYEFFLGKFAMAEGQGGGEFFTPTSVVKYMVEVIEPYRGTIFDPACGSGGMFVQSSHFIDRRRAELHSTDAKDLFVYGTEKTLETVKLAKMNIVVNGLRGDIKQANAYYENPFDSFGHFDYVMANPPFNVKEVNYDRVKDDPRFSTYGIPQNKSKGKKKKEGEENLVPNANYLWINLFATSLKPEGRAALVMANSASDARHSERDIREHLVRRGLIAQMVTLSSNMFSTVTLPASLWFFDKSRMVEPEDGQPVEVLFVDARNVYRQVDRATREFTQEQVWNLATITRLYQGETGRFHSLVHTYLEQAGTGFRQIRTQYEGYLQAFNTLAEAFRTWVQQAELDKEQQQLVQAEKLDEDLRLSPKSTYLDAHQAAAEALQAYLSGDDRSNAKQQAVAKTLTAFETEKRQARKTLERAYRALEQKYKRADKELRGRSDADWKALPKLKDVRAALDAYLELANEQINREPQQTEAADGKSPIYFLKQLQWLQQRFPEGQYEDVTGLCKAASLAEIEEQDFSLNPGRYVGVVIEEDGLTEEEFYEELEKAEAELSGLNAQAAQLANTISVNLKELMNEQ